MIFYFFGRFFSKNIRVDLFFVSRRFFRFEAKHMNAFFIDGRIARSRYFLPLLFFIFRSRRIEFFAYRSRRIDFIDRARSTFLTVDIIVVLRLLSCWLG